MNVKYIILAMFFIVGSSFNFIPHTTIDEVSAPIAFKDSESVVYKVYYNLGFVWMPAGEVTFTVKENASDYYFKAKGRTYSSYEWFFKVEDTYESWVDKNTLYPKSSLRDVKEGSYRLYDKVDFDQTSRIATSYRGSNVDETKMTKYDLSENMHDVLSLIYYTRSLDTDQMSKGDKVPLKIFMDKEEQKLSMTYKGEYNNKKIKNNGRKDVLLFEPELIGGDTFKEGDKMKLWVSKDVSHLPYMIESPLSVGSIKVVLKSADNVSY